MSNVIKWNKTITKTLSIEGIIRIRIKWRFLMFAFFKEKTIRNLVVEANVYLRKVYRQKPPTVRVRKPEKPRFEEKPIDTDLQAQKAAFNTKYSLQPDYSDIKFSLKRAEIDQYDSEAVNSFMQRLNADQMDVDPNREIDRIIDRSFGEKLREHIIKKGYREPQVYRRAQVDRRVFSKILSGYNKPSRDTAIALSIALKLDLEDTIDFLSRAGYTLSHSNKKDVVIEYFIREKHYNIFDINEVLHRLGQPIIGR
jgi:transcriptional regulator with XRE-family HTH domain